MNKVVFIILVGVVFLGFLYHLESNASTFVAVQDGNWNDPDTWGGDIPGASDDKVIPSGITVVMMSSISNSGTLTVNNSNLATIGIRNVDTITNPGTIIVSNSGTNTFGDSK